MSSSLNGWYYVIPKTGLPCIQERVNHMVQERLATILASGEFVAFLQDVSYSTFSNTGNHANEYKSKKPKLVDPFNVEQDGEIIFTLTEPLMIAKVTAELLKQ